MDGAEPMILIGQYDSPFVRRVGIALKLYELPFEHCPWSTFGDADRIRPYNPLTRVPTLVLDSGEVLIESYSILDYLDGLVTAERAMFPRSEPARRQALNIASLATGVGEKAVSLFYEKTFHREISETWVSRCRKQIIDTLSLLETIRNERKSAYWLGDRIGHADIAVAVVLRFLGEAHPGLISSNDIPILRADAERLEALPIFAATSQPFIPPA
jgi:glutathione S-transferase